MVAGITVVAVKARRDHFRELGSRLARQRVIAAAVSVHDMRWLVPGVPSSVELSDAYDWPQSRWVRACMVMGLDGSITGPDGLSGSISSSTDRAVMSTIRRFADAYLVGAGTVRAERYGAVRSQPEAIERRVAAGQAAAPTLAIVSASCRFDWEHAAFTGSDIRPIVLTVQSSDPADRAAAARWCEVVVIGEERVEPGAALAALADRGLTRVTCEGGDSLLTEMVRADALDEVDLTLAPVVAASARPARPGPAALAGMRLHQLLEDDGFLFARYVRGD
jgi:riboflavin biosynthesis pyrimidine reductase